MSSEPVRVTVRSTGSASKSAAAAAFQGAHVGFTRLDREENGVADADKQVGENQEDETDRQADDHPRLEKGGEDWPQSGGDQRNRRGQDFGREVDPAVVDEEPA